MKHFYYCLLFIVITGCQQQQVPEIFYDLDAESILNETRAMQQQILYQAPLETVIDKELQLFHGMVTHLDAQTKDKKKPIIVKVKNEMEVILEFEVSPTIANLMELEMELMVRYMRNDKKNTVVEIKKATW